MTESEPWWEREGLSALHVAAYVGDVEAVRAMLRGGHDPNAVDVHGNTPLYSACFKGAVSGGYVDVVRALVAAGVDVRRCGEDMEPPLFAACRAGVGEIVRELIRGGADVRATQGNRAAIAIAAAAGSVACVEALLEAGADPEGRGEFGLTAREWAESIGSERIIALLDAAVRRGA